MSIKSLASLYVIILFDYKQPYLAIHLLVIRSACVCLPLCVLLEMLDCIKGKVSYNLFYCIFNLCLLFVYKIGLSITLFITFKKVYVIFKW